MKEITKHKANLMLERFLSRKGQIVAVNFSRPVKTRKEFSHLQIEKHCSMVARAGVNYDNMANVQAKRESGELPEVNQGLPWGKWKEGFFPHIIEHKGSDYLRFATLNGGKVKTRFTLNGKETTREEIESYCLASEFPKEREDLDVFTIKAENIKDIR